MKVYIKIILAVLVLFILFVIGVAYKADKDYKSNIQVTCYQSPSFNLSSKEVLSSLEDINDFVEEESLKVYNYDINKSTLF
jgi:hypothetical protein